MSSSDSRFTDIWEAVDPFDPDYPHLWIKVEHLGRYLFAAQYLASNGADHVVDAGCGPGYGTGELARTCAHVTAIDDDEAVLELARQRNAAENVRFEVASVGTGILNATLGIAAQDAIACFETLEHLTDPASALAEFFALLRPGGTLIVSAPNGVNERTDDSGLLSNTMHRRVFSISSISELLVDAGFLVTEVLGQPLTNTINGNETRLIRRKQTDGRIGDEPSLHRPATIRRMALAIGYPEPRDIERSYSIIVVANRPEA